MSELLAGGLLSLLCVLWARLQSDRELMACREGRRAERLADVQLRELDPEFARELGLFEPELLEREKREEVVAWAQRFDVHLPGVILGSPLPPGPSVPPATQFVRLPPRPNVPNSGRETR